MRTGLGQQEEQAQGPRRIQGVDGVDSDNGNTTHLEEEGDMRGAPWEAGSGLSLQKARSAATLDVWGCSLTDSLPYFESFFVSKYCSKQAGSFSQRAFTELAFPDLQRALGIP